MVVVVVVRFHWLSFQSLLIVLGDNRGPISAGVDAYQCMSPFFFFIFRFCFSCDTSKFLKTNLCTSKCVPGIMPVYAEKYIGRDISEFRTSLTNL